MGWKLRFLRDFMHLPGLKDANMHIHPFVEVIVCSRAMKFAGTYYSTFTGYIHRLRGYHGLGEESYHHAPVGATFLLQDARSVGSGWMREWRAGWTNEDGELL